MGEEKVQRCGSFHSFSLRITGLKEDEMLGQLDKNLADPTE